MKPNFSEHCDSNILTIFRKSMTECNIIPIMVTSIAFNFIHSKFLKWCPTLCLGIATFPRLLQSYRNFTTRSISWKFHSSIRHLSVRNLLIQIFKIIYLSYLLNYVRIVSFRKPSTAWKVSKYRVISGPYFPVFSPNTGKYGPEITPYLDIFHAVTYFLVTYLIVSKGEKHLALFGIKH